MTHAYTHSSIAPSAPSAPAARDQRVALHVPPARVLRARSPRIDAADWPENVDDFQAGLISDEIDALIDSSTVGRGE